MKRSERPIVVLGAGPAGLGAAHWLAKAGHEVVVLEKEPRVGGMGASIRIKDYVVDYGPHTFHLKKTPVTELFERLVGADTNRVRREARLWLQGKLLPFPLTLSVALTELNPLLSTRIIGDYLYERSLGRLSRPAGWKPASFEAWGVQEFGRALYQLAFGDYSEKMWGLPGGELSVKLAKQKLTGLSLRALLLDVLGLLSKDRAEKLGLSREVLYDAYPKMGIGTFFEAMAEEIRAMGGAIELSAQLQSLDIVNGQAKQVTYTANGRLSALGCEAVISSIPLAGLTRLLPASDFAMSQHAAARLAYRSLCVVHLVLDRDYFSNAHWIYLLDRQLVSNRLSEQKNLSRDSCPPGRTVVTFDITCQHGDYLWKADDSFLIGLAMHDLSVMGVHPRTVLDAFVLRAPNVYPVYSIGFEREVKTILDQLQGCGNLFSIGRHGLLLNNDMHDSIEMGFFAARTFAEGQPSGAWYGIAERYVRERLEGIVRDPIRFDHDTGAIKDREGVAVS